MTDTNDHTHDLRSLLIEDAKARAGEHAEIEVLVDYSAGSLDAESAEPLRDHLAVCRACADRLLELRPLLQPEAGPADGVADMEIEAAWRRMRKKLGEGRTTERRDTRLSMARALAACLAMTSLALGLWVWRLQVVNTDLEQSGARGSVPVVNMPVLYLGGGTRASGSSPESFEVPASASHLALFFSITDPVPADEYEVQVFNGQGQLVLRQAGLVVSDSGSLRLGLPRSLLPAGDYRIVLRASRSGDWQAVEEFRSTVVYR